MNLLSKPTDSAKTQWALKNTMKRYPTGKFVSDEGEQNRTLWERNIIARVYQKFIFLYDFSPLEKSTCRLYKKCTLSFNQRESLLFHTIAAPNYCLPNPNYKNCLLIITHWYKYHWSKFSIHFIMNISIFLIIES